LGGGELLGGGGELLGGGRAAGAAWSSAAFK